MFVYQSLGAVPVETRRVVADTRQVHRRWQQQQQLFNNTTHSDCFYNFLLQQSAENLSVTFPHSPTKTHRHPWAASSSRELCYLRIVWSTKVTGWFQDVNTFQSSVISDYRNLFTQLLCYIIFGWMEILGQPLSLSIPNRAIFQQTANIQATVMKNRLQN